MTITIAASFTLALALLGPVPPTTRLQQGMAPTDVVAAIIRADYTGNRPALETLGDLLPPDHQGPRAARYRYWRGFASWRRAINGVNIDAERSDLERDLERAIREFDAALTADPSFTDAKVGIISCLQILGFLNRADAARLRDLVSRFVALLKQSLAEASDHPRLLWVTGQSEWYTPANAPPNVVRERQARAIATYERGLRLARAATRSADGLEPSWGEPELLMNLAWAHLNKVEPDVAVAESYARQALALVPEWQYLRDILMPQIQRARRRAGGASLLPAPR
jgi:hypothetical protein